MITRPRLVFHPQSPRVRPWPYPYRAAVAISNDVEYCGFNYFELLMRHLNTSGQTPWGMGLNLEITSSFFFYSDTGGTFSWFAPGADPDRESAESTRLAEYIRSGWCDTIHAYGEFDQSGAFTRKHALRAIEALHANGLKTPVFSNHGNERNHQNVGTDASYHRGDRTGDSAYHADLLKEMGVSFLWTDSLVYGVGGFGLRPWLREWRRRRHRRAPCPTLTLRDGQCFTGFHRYRGVRGPAAPNLGNLHAQLGTIDWDDFVARGEWIFIYQHLGVREKVAGRCLPADANDATGNQRRLESLRVLADWRDAGKIWVVGQARLLQYLRSVHTLRPAFKHLDGMLTIELPESWEAPHAGGVTFYLPPEAAGQETVRIIHGDLDTLRLVNPPDHQGKTTVGLPERHLPSIW